MRKILFLLAISFVALGFNRVKLSSGTEIIYSEDHSYPLVSVAIGIQAGSSYEIPQEKGLSHFLEHMLFDGTYLHSRDELENSFARLGTYYNAFTRKDYVVFEFVSPPSRLIPSMKLITEMLFLSSFPPDEFAKEKGVVYQEIMKDYSNPMTASQYEFYRQFLPESPYAEPVLGYPQIIKNLSKERVINFWKRFYAPSRMKVVIIGDFSFEKAKEDIERIFSFPRKAERASTPEFSPAWKGLRFLKGKTQRLDIALPAPPPCSYSSPSYEILAIVLGRRLRKTLHFPYLSSEYEKHRGFAFLHFSTMGSAKADKIEKSLEEALSSSVKSQEVEEAKKEFFASRIMLFEKKIHMARQVAAWSIICPRGDWEQYISSVKKLTPKEVERARKWVRSQGKYFALVQAPWVKEKPTFKVLSPRISSSTLKNGLVFALLNLNGPVYASHIFVKRRAYLEKFPGEAHLLMKALEIELGNKFENLGVNFQFTDYPYFPFDDFYLSKDYAYMRFEGFSRQAVGKAVCLALTTPISPSSLQQAKKQILGELGYLSSRAPWVAWERLRALLLPSPLSLPLYGNPTLVSRADIDEIKRFRKAFLSPSNLIYTSSFSPLPECLKALGGQAPGEGNAEERVNVLSGKFRRAAFSMGWRVKWTRENYPAFLLLSHALRDALVEEVRERKGLAYSVGVSFVPYSRGEGILKIIIPTTKEKLSEVRGAVAKVISEFSPSKISREKLEVLRNSLAGRILRYGERKINRAYYMGYYLYLGFSPDYLWRLPSLVERVKTESLQALWDSLKKPVEVSVK